MIGVAGNLRRFVFTPNLTLKRFLNLSKIAVNYALKKPVLNSYPCRLIIDPVNTCVLKCPLCPTGKGDNTRVKSSMKFEDFKKIIDEVGEYVYEIDLYNWGESLLNSDIWKMITYCKDKKIVVKISSNMNYWREDFAEQIVKSGLDTLIVSCDGTDQESYEKYRVGGSFEKVMHHVSLVADAKKKLGAKHPELVWQFIVMRQNEHQVPIAEKEYRQYGFDVLRLVPVRTDTGLEIFQSDEKKIEGSKQWLPVNEKYSRFDYKKKTKKYKPKSCIYPWSITTINPNGSVSPCCACYPEKPDFGNVFDKGFKAVWNNENYVASRTAVARKDPKKKVVCENCVKYGFIE